jgi:hypothetical protein
MVQKILKGFWTSASQVASLTASGAQRITAVKASAGYG